jgi:hypothetical protein
VSDSPWENVDVDMKEAIDRRDNGDRDPAFYAARALESTIKIISDTKGWIHGGEKGAHNYIDNLASKRAGRLLKTGKEICSKTSSRTFEIRSAMDPETKKCQFQARSRPIGLLRLV